MRTRNNNNQEKITALYCRLSRDDEQEGDSNSIDCHSFQPSNLIDKLTRTELEIWNMRKKGTYIKSNINILLFITGLAETNKKR